MEILFLAQSVTVLLGFVRENVWTSILTLSIIEQRLCACQRRTRLTEHNYHAFFLKSKVAMRILLGSSLNLSRYSLSYSIGDFALSKVEALFSTPMYTDPFLSLISSLSISSNFLRSRPSPLPNSTMILGSLEERGLPLQVILLLELVLMALHGVFAVC